MLKTSVLSLSTAHLCPALLAPSRCLLVAIFLLLALVSPSPTPIRAISVSSCPTGSVVISGQALGSTSTISGIDNCDVLIEDCSAEYLQFTGTSITNSNITLRNLVCHTPANAFQPCVQFSASLNNMHNIIFDGIVATQPDISVVVTYSTVATVSGVFAHRNAVASLASTTGYNDFARFSLPVSNVRRLEFTNVSITCVTSSSSGVSLSMLANFQKSVSGLVTDDNSEIVFEGNAARGSVTSSSNFVGAFLVQFQDDVNAFNSISLTGNILSATVTSTTSNAQAAMAYFKGHVVLKGRRTSSITMSNNSMAGTQVQAERHATFAGLHAMTSIGFKQISRLIIDGLDMRECSVECTSGSSIVSLYFVGVYMGGSQMYFQHDQYVSIRRVFLSGSVDGGFGASTNVYIWQVPAFNVRAGVVEDCSIDFSGGVAAGQQVSATRSVDVFAVHAYASVTFSDKLVLQNLSITGKFVGGLAGSQDMQLRVIRFAGALSVQNLTINDTSIDVEAASSESSGVSVVIVQFEMSVTASQAGGNSDALSFNRNWVRTSPFSSSSPSITGKFVQVGVVWFKTSSGKSIADFNTLHISDNTIDTAWVSAFNGNVAVFVFYSVGYSLGTNDAGGGSLVITGNTMHGSFNSEAAGSPVDAAVVRFEPTITGQHMIDVSDNTMSARVSSTHVSYTLANFVGSIMLFPLTAAGAGAEAGMLRFVNNNMANSIIEGKGTLATTSVYGLDIARSTSTYVSAVGKVVVDGVDMRNLSVSMNFGATVAAVSLPYAMAMIGDASILVKNVAMSGSLICGSSQSCSGFTLSGVSFGETAEFLSMTVEDIVLDLHVSMGTYESGSGSGPRVVGVFFLRPWARVPPSLFRNISIRGNYLFPADKALLLYGVQFTSQLSDSANDESSRITFSEVSLGDAMMLDGRGRDPDSRLEAASVTAAAVTFHQIVTKVNQLFFIRCSVRFGSMIARNSAAGDVLAYVAFFQAAVNLQNRPLSSRIDFSNNHIEVTSINSTNGGGECHAVVAHLPYAVTDIRLLIVNDSVIHLGEIATVGSDTRRIVVNVLRQEAATGLTPLDVFKVSGSQVSVSSLVTPSTTSVTSEIAVVRLSTFPGTLSGDTGCVIEDHHLRLPPTVSAPEKMLAAVVVFPVLSGLTDNFVAIINTNRISTAAATSLPKDDADASVVQWCLSTRCSIVRFNLGSAKARGQWNFTGNTIEPNVGSSASLMAVKSAPFMASTKLFFERNDLTNTTEGRADVLASIGTPSAGGTSCCHSLSGASVTFGCNYWTNATYFKFDTEYNFSSTVSFTLSQQCPPTTTTTTTTATTTTSTTMAAPGTTTTTTTTTGSISSSTTSSSASNNNNNNNETTALVAVSTFPSLPSDLTEFPTQQTSDSGAPATDPPSGTPRELEEIDGQTNMTTIVNIVSGSSSTGQPPYSVSITTANPGLGGFIVKEDKLRSLGVTWQLYPPLNDNITLTSWNSTALGEAIKKGYVYTLSPEAIERNLTAKFYVQVTANDRSGNKTGKTAVPMVNLVINRGPQPMLARSGEASTVFNVSRGKKFVLEFHAFTHEQGLKLKLGVAQADMFPVPSNVRFLCDFFGHCTVRGMMEDAEPLNFEMQASDGYMVRATFFTIKPVAIPLHVNMHVVMLPVMLRPGRPFSYTLPSNLFTSSTEITYDGVTFANGFPLPPTIQFDVGSNVLRGTYSDAGLLQLRVKASDFFFVGYRNFTLNFTNDSPQCLRYSLFKESLDRYYYTHQHAPEGGIRSTTSSPPTPTPNSSSGGSLSILEKPIIMPVSALQPFERTVELSQLCTDTDVGDQLVFTISAFDLPQWMRFDVRPGGITALPQTLRLSGVPPLESERTSLFLINLTVSDTFAQTSLALPFSILPNVAPRRIAFMPNYTIAPGETETWSIQLSLYFADANADKLYVSTKMTSYAQTWLQSTVNSDLLNVILTAKPPDEISGSADDARESDEVVNITVTDPFGRAAWGVVNIHVRFTLWQKMKTAVYACAAVFSVIATIFSVIFFYPPTYNFFRAGSKRIFKCPIDADHPVYSFPKDVVRAEVTWRVKDDYCKALVNATRFVSIYLHDELSLEEFPLSDPPEWLLKKDRALELWPARSALDPTCVEPNPKEKECYVRLFSRRGFIVVQFRVDYDEATAGWVFPSSSASGDDGAQHATKTNNNNYYNNSHKNVGTPMTTSDAVPLMNHNHNNHTPSSARSASVPATKALEVKLEHLDAQVASLDFSKDFRIGNMQNEFAQVKTRQHQTSSSLQYVQKQQQQTESRQNEFENRQHRVEDEVQNLRGMLQQLLDNKSSPAPPPRQQQQRVANNNNMPSSRASRTYEAPLLETGGRGRQPHRYSPRSTAAAAFFDDDDGDDGEELGVVYRGGALSSDDDDANDLLFHRGGVGGTSVKQYDI